MIPWPSFGRVSSKLIETPRDGSLAYEALLPLRLRHRAPASELGKSAPGRLEGMYLAVVHPRS